MCWEYGIYENSKLARLKEIHKRIILIERKVVNVKTRDNAVVVSREGSAVVSGLCVVRDAGR